MKTVGRSVVLTMCLMLGTGLAISQALFTETFDYNEGALMTITGLNAGSSYYAAATASNNVSGGVWIPGSTTAFDDPLMVQSVALTYSGYSLSGMGKKLYCPNLAPNTSNNRGYVNFTSSQIVYYSMMLNMNDVTGLSAYPSANGEYFTGVWATGNATNANYRGLLTFRGGSNAAKFQLGVRSNQPTTVATTWYDVDLDVQTTYLVVVKYERNNPTCKASLWINPDLSGSEPTPNAVNDFGAVDPIGTNTDLGRFGIYQRGTKPHVWLGGIKIANAWGDAPLPVELSSFTATNSVAGTMLQWSTHSETGCFGFDIERRAIGDGEWTKVGFVKGNGTSSTSHLYRFADKSMVSGAYAYRLKQIDRDGTSSYSAATEVVVGNGAHTQLLESYPNPFNPATTVRFSVSGSVPASLAVYNMLGQKVAILFNGMTVGGKMYAVPFNASGFPSGIYFTRLDAGGKSTIQRLMLTK